MKKSMNINERIPVTITHVKENRKTLKKGKNKLCVDTMNMMDIFISLYNEESLRSSKLL
jgi:hypothetical protein